MKHSKIPSLFNSEFDPQNIRLMTKFTQNEINDGNTQIQDSVHSSKPIIFKMINFDRISQINTTFHLDESSNLSIFVGTANSDVFLAPKFSSIIKEFTPVQLADAPPPNGYRLLDLNLPYNPNDDANNANGNGVAPNGPPPPVNHGNGGGGGHNIGNGGGGGGGVVDGLNNLTIYRYNVLQQPVDYIDTTIIANNYNSWTTFAGAVYAIWVIVHGIPIANPVPEVIPSWSWPGSIIFFGRVVGGHYTDLSWP
uniref:Uncharacterized protein n=1 Tax=Chenopodium quinoa TaxID=63459 RepID=A0A803MMC2_CHEQI